MSKAFTLILLVVVLVLGLYFFLSRDGQEPALVGSSVPGESSASNEEVREVVIEASSFKFSLSQVEVKKGETVRFKVVNTQGVHDLVIDEFGVKTKIMSTIGEEDSFTFTADKVGSFEYYCSVGTHREMGMVGTLLVTE